MVSDTRISPPLRAAYAKLRAQREEVGASSATVFVVEGSALIGHAGDWDWIRTSFASEIESWPSVARALATDEACVISAGDAAGSERGWFESGGITRALCLPLRLQDGARGVLFVDFDVTRTLTGRCIAALVGVGAALAEVLSREGAPVVLH